jgi:hypothetical protein
MSKVRTFSRHFPLGHPRKGEKTFFVEQILRGLHVDYSSLSYLEDLKRYNQVNLNKGKLSQKDIELFWAELEQVNNEKHHTIRAGIHFKVGDKFSPRVWTKTPFYSPQIIFYDDLSVHYAPEVKVKNSLLYLQGKLIQEPQYSLVAMNDGLISSDMKAWFRKDLKGQIICWKKDLIY